MAKKHILNPLLLENQLCFPLYASARKIVAAYNPFLKSIGLTYAQYVTMMVLWEEKSITMHDLGERLYLDSGTLTPVLKKLEAMGYLERYRKPEDERLVMISLTDKGISLREEAEKIPHQMSDQLNKGKTLFTEKEVKVLKEQLYKLLQALEQREE